MDFLKLYQFSWGEFAIHLLISLTILKFITLLKVRFRRIFFSDGKIIKIELFLNRLKIIIEPIIIIYLTGAFISINIIYHGLILLVLIIIFFPNLRDYFTGRIMLFNNNLRINKKIKINDEYGIILKEGKFGIQIRTEQGQTYIGFSKLFNDGYTLRNDNEGSELCFIKISSEKNINLDNLKQSILEFFTTIPYIERSYKPLIKSSEKDNSVKIKVLLKKNISVDYLLKLLAENNFICEIIKDF